MRSLVFVDEDGDRMGNYGNETAYDELGSHIPIVAFCRTVRPLRSAAMITRESRVSPTRADFTIGDGG